MSSFPRLTDIKRKDSSMLQQIGDVIGDFHSRSRFNQFRAEHDTRERINSSQDGKKCSSSVPPPDGFLSLKSDSGRIPKGKRPRIIKQLKRHQKRLSKCHDGDSAVSSQTESTAAFGSCSTAQDTSGASLASIPLEWWMD